MTDEKICCPQFNPQKWNQKTYVWDKKPFIRESIPTFFHIPFPPMIAKKVTQMCKAMEDANKAEADKSEVLLLFRDPSAFRSEIFLSVTGPIENADNVNLSGTFYARVFAGPYSAVPKFIKKINEDLAAQAKTAKDYYVHYAYCPGCAKKYGHNYMIIFAQI